MFKRLDDPAADTVTIYFDDRPLEAAAEETVAMALLANGVIRTRTAPVGGGVRGPHCLIGNCFDCLVEIDGVANRQACMEPVRDGMQVRRQTGAREALQ